MANIVFYVSNYRTILEPATVLSPHHTSLSWCGCQESPQHEYKEHDNVAPQQSTVRCVTQASVGVTPGIVVGGRVCLVLRTYTAAVHI